jgi:hypothetical protein
LPSFKAFLSHRYKSSEINLYFFNLFHEIAEVQFEVDEGTFSTNVTRLERMVRDADAFIGIYPFPGTATEAIIPEELKKQSKYFRLEIDLAIRSQRPTIIFYDKRYNNLLKSNGNDFLIPFDVNEVVGTGGFPSYNKHKKGFKTFYESVKTRKAYEDSCLQSEKTVIALILPKKSHDSPYSDSCIEKIKEILDQRAHSDIIVIDWPLVLDNKLLRLLDSIDIAVVDIGGEVAMTGLPAYLHARFIPMIRLKYISDNNDNGLMGQFLFGGVEVGYQKDIVEWTSIETLQEKLNQKLEVINSSVLRINTKDEATRYFRSAALRKEIVFLSYSGKDLDFAKEFSSTLKKHFQKVFDYRDGESIRPGQPWLQDIFEQLSASAVGISLLSESYLASGNCDHELQQMTAKSDSGEMKLFPVKIGNDSIKMPVFLEHIQYIRRAEFGTIEDIVKKIISLL